MSAEAIESLIRGIRRCFNLLRARGDELHKDLAVTTAMRAVMESLSENGAQTVPQIARAKSVSRQHIQELVDALLERGLARFADNPAHRRSPLVHLTTQGAAAFRKMRRREAALLAELATIGSAQEIAASRRVLAALGERLSSLLAKPDDDETAT